MDTAQPEWRLSAQEETTYFKFANLSLPRHTSYPAVPAWKDEESEGAFEREIDELAEAERPVSLYFHIPFCEKLCNYCACNRLILGNKEEHQSFSRAFLEKVRQEIRHNLARKNGKWQVAQLHLGGGTPTFLSPGELEELFSYFLPYVTFTPDGERAVEIDPRVTSLEHLEFLRGAGFNRVSLGVQDFDPRVQEAVNRVQPFEMVRDFVAECQRLGFESINFDLIYGLPLQTLSSTQKTLDQVLELRPDRIAYYRLALIPEVFKWQRTFARGEVPHGRELLTMLLNAINFLTTSGYDFVGLDHFVRPTDSLKKAEEEHTLRRNFQGMTTGAELPIIAFGPSAISSFPRAFLQRPSDYYKWVRAPLNDVKKSLMLKDEDLLRRWVIEKLYCYRKLDKAEFARLFGEDFDAHFADRVDALEELARLGLVALSPEAIEVTKPLGFLLLRVVASVFDAYLPKDAYKTGISATQASKVG